MRTGALARPLPAEQLFFLKCRAYANVPIHQSNSLFLFGKDAYFGIVHESSWKSEFDDRRQLVGS